MRLILLIISFLILTSADCGSFRRNVKTLSDNVHLTEIVDPVSFSYLQSLDTLKKVGDVPRLSDEMRIITIRLKPLFMKKEADGDLHIVFCDPNNHFQTIICDSVNPSCLSDTKLYFTFRDVRSKISIFPVLRKEGNITYFSDILVWITGVPYHDYHPGIQA